VPALPALLFETIALYSSYTSFSLHMGWLYDIFFHLFSCHVFSFPPCINGDPVSIIRLSSVGAWGSGGAMYSMTAHGHSPEKIKYSKIINLLTRGIFPGLVSGYIESESYQ
jgi:hypothetical protein